MQSRKLKISTNNNERYMTIDEIIEVVCICKLKSELKTLVVNNIYFLSGKSSKSTLKMRNYKKNRLDDVGEANGILKNVFEQNEDSIKESRDNDGTS